MHLDADNQSRNRHLVDDNDSLPADADTIVDIQAKNVTVSQYASV